MYVPWGLLSRTGVSVSGEEGWGPCFLASHTSIASILLTLRKRFGCHKYDVISIWISATPFWKTNYHSSHSAVLQFKNKTHTPVSKNNQQNSKGRITRETGEQARKCCCCTWHSELGKEPHSRTLAAILGIHCIDQRSREQYAQHLWANLYPWCLEDV